MILGCMNKWLLFLMFVIRCVDGAEGKLGGRTPKLLVLIICSDQFPIYGEFQKVWRSYMHLDPEHVEAYFIRGNPDLEGNYEVIDDVIWSKTDEGWPPASAGILNKTIFSLEAMMSRIENEFDYVLRTNLSSVYNFPKLLKVLETLPRERCYFGSCPFPDFVFGSGSGFVLSSDLAKLLVEHKKAFLHQKNYDDVMIGLFLAGQGVTLIPHERMDILSFKQWNRMTKVFPDHIFHFRTKIQRQKKVAASKFIEEAEINQILVKMIYTGSTPIAPKANRFQASNFQ